MAISAIWRLRLCIRCCHIGHLELQIAHGKSTGPTSLCIRSCAPTKAARHERWLQLFAGIALCSLKNHYRRPPHNCENPRLGPNF
eukprot:3658828-Amphidinium_carterae.1